MKRLLPQSLLGQMLLAVGIALLVAQAISAGLQIRNDQHRRELSTANNMAFQLVADPRFDYRQTQTSLPGEDGRTRWRRLRVQRTPEFKLLPGEVRDTKREETLRTILTDRGIVPQDLIVVTRMIMNDDYVVGSFQRVSWDNPPEWAQNDMLLAAMRREGESTYSVARMPLASRDKSQIGAMIAQTLLLYALLVGGLAVLLRRITQPLAALTERVETFAETRNLQGQLDPSGPEDMRRLIVAHNAMEARIAGLLNEKNVMLGAIGHDLKTPLAALRVRIETVSDPIERDRMAHTIEDITYTLDDILSLARVGQPTDPMERTDLSALLIGVVEEYEDMGEPVELLSTQRIALNMRATWLRRCLRNLIGNALRYGTRARVNLVLDGRHAVITIDDDGPGIAANDVQAMMQPFARGEKSRNSATGGAGLGLTLARAIAEQHGGSLSLTNRTDAAGKVEGLTVEVRLPNAR